MDFKSHVIANFKELRQFNPALFSWHNAGCSDRYIIENLSMVYKGQSFYVSKKKKREYVLLSCEDLVKLVFYYYSYVFIDLSKVHLVKLEWAHKKGVWFKCT